MTTNRETSDKRSIRHYFILFVFLIISITIGFLSTISYFEVKGEIIEAYDEVMDHTDEMIRESIILVNGEGPDQGNGYSKEINAVLDAYIAEFFPSPDSSSSHPDTAPLQEQLQHLFGENIATSVHLVNVTDIPDSVRYSGPCVTGGVHTNPDGSITSSAYVLMPDGKSLLEAVAIIPQQEKMPAIYQYDIVRKARELNPFLKSVRVYDTAGDLVLNLTDPMNRAAQVLDPDTLHQILQTRTVLAVLDEQAETMTRYLFVDPDGGGDESIRIVEVTYDLQERFDHLNAVRQFDIVIGLLGIFFGALVTVISSWYVTRPVDDIVEDIGIIARGNLDHTIRKTKGLEFARLEGSINLMVGRLKEAIEKLRSSEEQVREYNENLEEIVSQRTEQLKLANEEANLYIDILLHDINNANTVTFSYLEFLKESDLSEEQKIYAEKALVGAQKSVEIIRDVGTIRKTYEKKTDLVPISLDQVIREEITHHPDTTIRYDGTDAVVLADDLLEEVFANLIGNSEKHAGKGTEIRIAVADRGDGVEVSVEDTGPGIQDDLKSVVFERARRGRSTTAPGSGLGLHICRSLVTWYGGKIRAEDRVAGSPEKGTAIRFTLRKYPGPGHISGEGGDRRK
jgi:two-component system sensor histidine kinase BarA